MVTGGRAKMARMLLGSTPSWYRSLNALNGFANGQRRNDLRMGDFQAALFRLLGNAF